MQPQGAFDIDWSSPLSSGLQLFFDATNRRDLVSGGFGTVTGSKVVGSFGWNGVRASGFGATSGASTDDRITLSSYTQKDGPRTQAVWFYARTTGGGGSGRLFTKPTTVDQAGGSEGVAIGSVANSLRVWRYDSAGVKLFEQLVIVPTMTNLFGCFFVTHDGSAGSGFTFYFNGRSVGSSAATAIVAGAPDSEPLYIGNRPDLTRCWDGWIGPVMQWGRVLSAAEVYQITQNPWQILQPQRRQLFAVVSDVIVRPSSDVTTTGWTAYPDPPLYAKIDEVTPDDNDYITSPDLNSTPGPYIGGIAPIDAGVYDVRFRARRTLGSGQARVSLLDSSNVVQGTSGWITLTESFAKYTASVTTTGTATRVRIEVQP
jgi:hypothetical protein